MIYKPEKKAYNKSTFFILPILGESWKYWEGNKIYNCYVADFDKPEYTNNILTLFDYQGTIPYTKFEESLQARVDYVDKYDIKNKGYSMFVFTVPKEFEEPYDLFSKSKYSNFSTEYKDRILDFFEIDKVRARYEVLKKPERPSLSQILFPKKSDREFYIKDRTGCDYENWWEIYDRINNDEIFDQRNLRVYNTNKVELTQ